MTELRIVPPAEIFATTEFDGMNNTHVYILVYVDGTIIHAQFKNGDVHVKVNREYFINRNGEIVIGKKF